MKGLAFICVVYIQILISPSHSAIDTPGDHLQGLVFIVQNGYTAIPSNETYPNDEYSVPEYWPDGYGQLTILGKEKVFKIGQSIESKYANLLTTNPHNAYVQSYDDTPCFETAELLAAGAFPPNGRWVWNEKLLWQPIKVNTSPRSNDSVLGTSIPCEISSVSNIQTREAYIQLTKAHTSLLAYIEEEAGFDNMTIKQFLDLYTTIILEDSANLPRLTWINQTVWQEMSKFVSDLAYLMYSVDNVQKAVAGPLLSQIATNIESIQKTTDGPKVFIYVTQQPKMISVLASLLINNTQEIFTRPGSVIGIEVYKSSEKGPYFHLTFNDGDKIETWKPLAMYGCNEDCPMDHFYRYVNQVSPITGEQLCSLSTDSKPVTFPSIPRSSEVDDSTSSQVPESASSQVPESAPLIAAEEEIPTRGRGWKAFLITILCMACLALIALGVTDYIKRRRRVEYLYM